MDRDQLYSGYGCACLTMIADPRTQDVTHILSARFLPLKACHTDPALKKPE